MDFKKSGGLEEKIMGKYNAIIIFMGIIGFILGHGHPDIIL